MVSGAVPVNWAAEYVGIPFREHGRDRTGCDCWGLYRLAYGERFGVWLEEYVCPAERAVQADTIRREAEFAAVVLPGQVQPGDAVFLRALGVVSHIGMVLGGGMMLHTRRGTDAAIEPYRRGRWAQRVAGFRRP